MTLIITGSQPKVHEVENADAFIAAMNNRPDVGRVEVWIQVRGGAFPDTWTDLVEFWSGEWDRTRPIPRPTKAELVAAAEPSGARFARTVIRSKV